MRGCFSATRRKNKKTDSKLQPCLPAGRCIKYHQLFKETQYTTTNLFKNSLELAKRLCYYDIFAISRFNPASVRRVLLAWFFLMISIHLPAMLSADWFVTFCRSFFNFRLLNNERTNLPVGRQVVNKKRGYSLLPRNIIKLPQRTKDFKSIKSFDNLSIYLIIQSSSPKFWLTLNKKTTAFWSFLVAINFSSYPQGKSALFSRCFYKPSGKAEFSHNQ